VRTSGTRDLRNSVDFYLNMKLNIKWINRMSYAPGLRRPSILKSAHAYDLYSISILIKNDGVHM
jgi:hypothetical protein